MNKPASAEFFDNAVDNGYLCVPIPYGEKGPKIPGWNKINFGKHPEKLPADFYEREYNVGILCGVCAKADEAKGVNGTYAVYAIDIDCDVSEVTDALINFTIKYCNGKSKGSSMALMCRRGRKNRALLVFSGKPGRIKSISSVWETADGKKCMIEFLGAGQQFVAFGRHPSGIDYTYTQADTRYGTDKSNIPTPANLLGSLNQRIDLDDDFCNSLSAELDKTCKSLSMTKVKAEKGTSAVPQGGETGLINMEPPIDITDERVKETLSHLSADDRDLWVDVGMALQHQYQYNPDLGFQIFDEWSSRSSKYKGTADCERVWKSFHANTGRRQITFKSILDKVKKLKQRASDKRLKTVIEDMETALTLEDLRKAFGSVVPKTDYEQKKLEAAYAENLKRFNIEPTKDEIKEAAPLAPSGEYELSENGNAQRMIDLYRGKILFNNTRERWLTWDGVIWKYATDDAIKAIARESIEAIDSEVAAAEDDGDEKLAKRLRGWKIKSSTDTMYRHMVSIAATYPEISKPDSAFDADRFIHGTLNGAIDIRTGQALPPDPKLLLTRQLGFAYDKTAKCPRFIKHIRAMFADQPEITDFVLDLFAVALTGRNTYNILPIFWGSGANGKSTLFNALQHVFGDYAATADASTFVSAARNNAQASGAAREDLIRLQGRNFVLISETDNGATFREGAVKAMTGGDKIVARAPYSRSSLEFNPAFVPFMQTNNLPHIPTAGNAAWARRLTPIACNNNIMKMFKPDPAIDDVLKAEAAGIFNLILEHALIVLAKGLTIPESVRKAREDYRNSEDLLGEFIDDCVEVMPESESAVLEEYTVSKSALYIAFSNYANNAGEGDSIKSRKWFCNMVRQRFPGIREDSKKIDGVTYRRFLGIRLKGKSDEAVTESYAKLPKIGFA